jgi:hypothetical protein
LHGRAHVSDLVEEERAAVGELDAPWLLRRSARERALLVAEDLGLEEVVGERGAVDRDERAAFPRAPVVDRARHELLARAALAADEHDRLRLGGAIDEREALGHRGRSSEDVTTADRALDGPLHLRCAHRLVEHVEHVLAFERLEQEVRRATLHRFHGELDRAVRREHDDGQLRVAGLELREERHPVHAGHAEIRDDRVEWLHRHHAERSFAGRLVPRLKAGLLEQAKEHRSDGDIIVDDEDGLRGGAHEDSPWYQDVRSQEPHTHLARAMPVPPGKRRRFARFHVGSVHGSARHGARPRTCLHTRGDPRGQRDGPTARVSATVVPFPSWLTIVSSPPCASATRAA